jgi:hypothetical protein
MHIALAVILVAHAVAHLGGFVGPWRVTRRVPHKTTVLAGHLDLGEVGARLLGLLWVACAAGFVAGAVGLVLHAWWWLGLVLPATGGSLVLCVLGWPDARAGIAIDATLVLAIMLGTMAARNVTGGVTLPATPNVKAVPRHGWCDNLELSSQR